MSITWICLTLSKVKRFSEINIELMEIQNQVRVETLFPDFCFQYFWRFSYVDGAGNMLPHPKNEPTVIGGFRVAKSFFC